MEAAAADDDVAVDAVEAVLSTVELLENILQFVTGPRNIVRTSQVRSNNNPNPPLPSPHPNPHPHPTPSLPHT